MQHKLQYNGSQQKISITNNGTIATNTMGEPATVTHSSMIQCDANKSYIWNIKCVKYKYPWHWSIGLQPADKQYDDTYFDEKDLSYSYYPKGCAWAGKKEIEDTVSYWGHGDILSVSYSPKIKELSLSINDQKQQHYIKIKHHPKGYKLAIYMHNKGDCAELMDFIVIGDNDGNEEEKKSTLTVKEIDTFNKQQKLVKSDENQKVLIAINESLKSQNQQNELETNTLKNEVLTLKQSLKSKESQLNQAKQENIEQRSSLNAIHESLKLQSQQQKSQNDTLKNENEALQRTQRNLIQTIQAKESEITESGKVIQDLRKEIEQLKSINSSLMDDQKENQLEIQRLMEENKALKLAAIDINKFKTWQWEQVLQWILTCNDGKFKKYEQELRKNLEIEQPSGKQLEDVDRNDIRSWGITQFGDIKEMLALIQSLPHEEENQNDNDNNDILAIADEEGAVSGEHHR